MKDWNENHISTYGSINGVMVNYSAIVTADTALSASYAIFTGKYGELLNNSQASMIDTKGVAVDKMNKKEAMVDEAVVIALLAQGWAAAVNNPVVFEEMKMPKSKLMKMRDTTVAAACKNIFNLATTHSADLLAYGVTPLMLTSLDGRITAYEAVVSKPREALIPKKVANANMERLIKEISDLLKNRMDKNMAAHKTANPDFYDEYFNARELIDATGSRVSIRGKVTDKQTGGVLALVNVELVEKGLTLKTSKTGVFSFSGLESSTFTLRLTKKTFVDNVVSNIKFEWGKLTRLNVEMIKTSLQNSFQPGMSVSIAAGATSSYNLGMAPLGLWMKVVNGSANQLLMSVSNIAGAHNPLGTQTVNPYETFIFQIYQLGTGNQLVMTNNGSTLASVIVQKSSEIGLIR